MARIISLSNHKGGVGKTTSVVNIGVGLGNLNHKVLLIDLDPQANLSSGLGASGREENIAKYFKEIVHFRSPTILPYSLNSYVDIIPGNIGLFTIGTITASSGNSSTGDTSKFCLTLDDI